MAGPGAGPGLGKGAFKLYASRQGHSLPVSLPGPHGRGPAPLRLATPSQAGTASLSGSLRCGLLPVGNCFDARVLIVRSTPSPTYHRGALRAGIILRLESALKSTVLRGCSWRAWDAPFLTGSTACCA